MNDPYKILNISRDASDAQVKKAYLDLARKYHPDNYHDNPLADLAQEKMKEINAAYEQITKERGSRANNNTANGGYGGYGSSAAGQTQGYGGSSAFQQVRLAINRGDLTRAEGLLNAITEHNGEWNFLRGTICYRRGWLDEARRYYQTACQIEPGNAEYRQALEYMESGGQTAYQSGGTFGGDACGGDVCSKLCCTYLLCNGVSCGGMRFCCI